MNRGITLEALATGLRRRLPTTPLPAECGRRKNDERNQGSSSVVLRVGAVETVVLELPPQRGAADAQRLRCPRLVPPTSLERLDDMRPFDLGEILLGREHGRRPEARARDDVRREVVGRDGLTAREDGGALDRVLQLAHVPGPGVRQQSRARGGGQAQGATTTLRGPGEEMLGKKRNVLAPLAQRWELDEKDIEPIVEILPESAF